MSTYFPEQKTTRKGSKNYLFFSSVRSPFIDFEFVFKAIKKTLYFSNETAFVRHKTAVSVCVGDAVGTRSGLKKLKSLQHARKGRNVYDWTFSVRRAKTDGKTTHEHPGRVVRN